MQSKAIRLGQIAVMTALIIVLGFIPPIPLGVIPVPIVIQNLGIMLAAIILGTKNGTFSVWLFLIIGFCGIPVFPGQANGLTVLFSPSGGYVIAWVLTPLLIGLILKHFNVRSFSMTFITVWLVGVLFTEILGGCFLSWYTHTSLKADLIANLAFIPGDTIKALLASWIGLRIRKIIRI
ncbi:MAG TPA: biotin transporter BioY [Candidatus Ligilactobacillus excrementigallinarum]|uniref:Biotin transporter n=1 Tax=Candidatus Ligilactobacillus excrementigallinarum TaxID=2838641 RepID=A0A9D1UXD7_9LACO|nr:biotin transporter BioY [Candidatus Ligilactobacillus excrementigallinarum]